MSQIHFLVMYAGDTNMFMQDKLCVCVYIYIYIYIYIYNAVISTPEK